MEKEINCFNHEKKKTIYKEILNKNGALSDLYYLSFHICISFSFLVNM